MNKIYHLSSCNSCQRIIRELGNADLFEYQDIKEKNISAAQLDKLARETGSYEALFSRRARKYQSMGLASRKLAEKDYRKLILEEYTFLKRPVVIIDDEVFVGNAPSVVKQAVEKLEALKG